MPWQENSNLKEKKQFMVALLLLLKLQKLWPQHVTKCSIRMGEVSLANALSNSKVFSVTHFYFQP